MVKVATAAGWQAFAEAEGEGVLLCLIGDTKGVMPQKVGRWLLPPQRGGLWWCGAARGLPGEELPANTETEAAW
jgi:hypothetical protein